MKYVTNLEISKRLKDLGVKQESEYYWCEILDSIMPHANGITLTCGIDNAKGYSKSYEKVNIYSAFLVGELGEMLNGCLSGRYAMGDCYFAQNGFPASADHCFEDKSEANCRGKLLIYLLEQGLIKKEEI